jgi:hypothetical protein
MDSHRIKGRNWQGKEIDTVKSSIDRYSDNRKDIYQNRLQLRDRRRTINLLTEQGVYPKDRATAFGKAGVLKN